jgi:farnesyl diphosphate synthase
VVEFQSQMAAAATIVERRLVEILDAQQSTGVPQRLLGAMRHGVLGGGKRFRPFLVMETAKLFGVSPDQSVNAAAALECIHCYSLVHDDMPAMDNDELRRGQPTVWKAYDEWTAILVGDGLQSLAFEIVSDPTNYSDHAVRADLTFALAKASGAAGMVGGQALDLEAGTIHADTPPDVAHIARLQAMKTGKLISVACEMGAILGRASDEQRAALTHFGDCVGFAFQISDDLLDAEGATADVGKATGKDAAAGKATLVSLTGIERAREHLDKAVSEALKTISAFGRQSSHLAAAAEFMGRRKA